MAQNENTPVNQEKSGIIGFLSGVKSELKKVKKITPTCLLSMFSVNIAITIINKNIVPLVKNKKIKAIFLPFFFYTIELCQN